jgi:hypothetical protein
MRRLRPGAVIWLALGLAVLALWGVWTQGRRARVVPAWTAGASGGHEPGGR